MTEQPLLNVRQVAKRLNVHPETVRRWIRDGRLPAIDLGSPRAGLRVRPEVLEQWLRGELPEDAR
jgi:excisionase family DNA binding protein